MKTELYNYIFNVKYQVVEKYIDLKKTSLLLMNLTVWKAISL